MKKLLLLSLIIFIFLAIKPMEDPEETKKPTKIEKFEEFQQLPKEIQKEVLLQLLDSIARNDSLKTAVENIRNAMLVNKEWKEVINNEDATNKLVHLMLQNPKIKEFFNEIEKNRQLGSFWKPKNDFNNEIKKNLLLIALGNKEAQNLLMEADLDQIHKVLYIIFLSIEKEIPESIRSDLFYLLTSIFKFLNSKNYEIKSFPVMKLLQNLVRNSSANDGDFINFLVSIEDLEKVKQLRKKSKIINEFFDK